MCIPMHGLSKPANKLSRVLLCPPFHGSCTMNAKDDPSSLHPAATDGGWIEKASEAKDLSMVLPHAKQMCHSCSRPKAQPTMPHSCSRRFAAISPKIGAQKWPVSFHQACCNGLSQWRPLQCRWSDSNKDQLRKARCRSISVGHRRVPEPPGPSGRCPISMALQLNP